MMAHPIDENEKRLYNDLICDLENKRAKVAGDDGDQWSLRDVMLHLYGFEPDSVDKEKEIISNLNNFQGIEIHDSELIVCKKKKELKVIPQKKFLQPHETWEGLELTREWLQELETNIFSLVRSLLTTMQQTEAEKSQFQEFKTELQQLKDSKNGRVPIVVYRTLAALDGLLSRMEEPNVGNEERKVESVKEIKNGQDFKKLVHMILRLEYVLSHISSLLISEDNRPLREYCLEVLKKSNKTLDEVQVNIIGANLWSIYRKRSIENKGRSTIPQSNKRSGESENCGGESKKHRGGGESC